MRPIPSTSTGTRFKRGKLLLCLFQAALCGPGFAAATVDNTAIISYQVGQKQTAATSNTVRTTIDAAPSPISVAFYAAGSGAGAQSFDVSGGCIAASAGGPVGLVPAVGIAAGLPLYIVVTDSRANRDKTVRDTVVVSLTLGADTEVLKLVETGPDTGIFAGVIATSAPGVDNVVAGDCKLTTGTAAANLQARYFDADFPINPTGTSIPATTYNVVFNATTGAPVDGAVITITDLGSAASQASSKHAVPGAREASGKPAIVFGIDGHSIFPSTVTSGSAVRDASGRLYIMPKGGFTFPYLAVGHYHIEVIPPAGLNYPSVATPEALSSTDPVSRKAVAIASGSFGRDFDIVAPGPLLFDLPLDSISTALLVTKTASVAAASAGDFVQYRVEVRNTSAEGKIQQVRLNDVLPRGFRYQPGSLRVGGVTAADPSVAADGVTLIAALPPLAAGGATVVSYVTRVTPLATAGDAVNAVFATPGAGKPSNTAVALVKVGGELFSDAVTIIGRVVSDACSISDGAARSVPGIRILLEDGTYAVTDDNGQYHIENVRPGLHVAQLDRNSLPDGFRPAARCHDDTRHAGSRISQFIDARGGALWRADFFLDRDARAVAPSSKVVVRVAPDAEAAGVRNDWISKANGQNAFLFPDVSHNPRSPALRVVLAHAGGTSVVLELNGIRVDELSFDTSVTSVDKTAAVDTWHGLILHDGTNRLEAKVYRSGKLVETVRRDVAYANSADHAVLVAELSKLGADGRTNPVVAVRILDRAGKPVRAGVSGKLDVAAPFQTAAAVQARRQSQLATVSADANIWRVVGDDGIAYIELAPTTQTGEVSLNLHVGERSQSLVRTIGSSRSLLDTRDEIHAWLVPAQRDWVVVGFAAGSAGYTTIARQAETLGSNPQDTNLLDGQVKLFAKGRVKGKWLLTLAYDSAKRSDRQRRQSILSTIDPNAYYTLYGDATQQGFDAQSTRNLFIRLETDRFYALFGDFSTNLNRTELGRYARTLTGIKSEFRSKHTAFEAFAAESAFRHQRDEVQGDGLTGPYRLGRTDAVRNTDHVVIETRDRNRPELLVSTRELTRYLDYTIDQLRGTITLREPLPSRDLLFNPTFIVVDYEVEGTATSRTVAGARASAKFAADRVVLGATALLDDGDQRGKLGAIDGLIAIDRQTSAHLEAGASKGDTPKIGHAYIAEVERRTPSLDARIYAREQSQSFGVGQQNAVESGTRKIGFDGQARVATGITVAASLYDQEELTSAARRIDGRLEARAKLRGTDVAVGLERVSERSATLVSNQTTQISAAASRSFLSNRLVVTSDYHTSVSGPDSVTTPSRYSVGASYALFPEVRLNLQHEIATGGTVTTANDRVGIEATPWRGAHLGTSFAEQRAGENGNRLLGVFGAGQTFHLSKRWTSDLAVDSSRNLAGSVNAVLPLLDPLHPPAIGGRLDNGLAPGILDANYTAVSAALGYHGKGWSWNGRLEGRLGDARRYGLTSSIVRQLDEGKVYGGVVTLYRLHAADGSRTDHGDAAFSIALRAPQSRLQMVDKLEALYDRISPSAAGLVAGAPVATLFSDPGTLPGAPILDKASSSRLVNNLAANWIAAGDGDGSRTQASLYYGSKYTIQTFDGRVYSGYTDMLSVELRQDLLAWLDIGVQSGCRHDWRTGTLQWSAGPTLGIAPMHNGWISIGYNVSGFHDRDFSGSDATIKGPWVAFRLKFDEDSLGLSRPRR